MKGGKVDLKEKSYILHMNRDTICPPIKRIYMSMLLKMLHKMEEKKSGKGNELQKKFQMNDIYDDSSIIFLSLHSMFILNILFSIKYIYIWNSDRFKQW